MSQEHKDNSIKNGKYDASITLEDFKGKMNARNINQITREISINNIESSDRFYKSIISLVQALGFMVGSVFMISKGIILIINYYSIKTKN